VDRKGQGQYKVVKEATKFKRQIKVKTTPPSQRKSDTGEK